MTPKQALAFVEEHGIVLQSARGRVPSFADFVAGERIRGSWWGHPRGKEIYRLAEAVIDSGEVLVCRLVDGKVTYVHRRLWPALVRLSDRLSRQGPRPGLVGAHRLRRPRAAAGGLSGVGPRGGSPPGGPRWAKRTPSTRFAPILDPGRSEREAAARRGASGRGSPAAAARRWGRCRGTRRASWWPGPLAAGSHLFTSPCTHTVWPSICSAKSWMAPTSSGIDRCSRAPPTLRSMRRAGIWPRAVPRSSVIMRSPCAFHDRGRNRGAPGRARRPPRSPLRPGSRRPPPEAGPRAPRGP